MTHEGRFYAFRDAVCAPRPVQPHVPILIGGSGPKKTLPLVARSADLWNAYGTPEVVAAADAVLRAACEAAGRDEREIERTVNMNVVIRGDRAEAERAWAGWLQAGRPQEGEEDLEAGGSIEEVAGARPVQRRRVRAPDPHFPPAIRSRDHRPPAGAPGQARGLKRRFAEHGRCCTPSPRRPVGPAPAPG